MPAEWEPHRATWIAWPHHEPDWPGKLPVIPWVYAEIARVLADHLSGRAPDIRADDLSVFRYLGTDNRPWTEPWTQPQMTS